MDQGLLVERARHGDAQAFADLTYRYADASLRCALSILHDVQLAEDAVQEAFAAAFRSLQQLRRPDDFAAWLRSIVRFQCYRILRRRHALLVSLDHALQVADPDPDPQERLEQSERAHAVTRAVVGLPETLQDVVRLFYFGDLSQREIAALLDMPVTTVNNRLHAARKKLRGGLSMVDEVTTTETEEGKAGKVVAVHGPVIDVQFAPGQMPRLLTALEFDDEAGRGQATAQVIQILAGDLVRCVAALERRSPALGGPMRNTEAGMSVPISSRVVELALENLSELS